MRLLTTREVAEQTGFSVQKILGLIKAGRLAAVNTSTGNCKARWSVPEEELNAFLKPTNSKAEPQAKPVRKRERIDSHVTNKVFS